VNASGKLSLFVGNPDCRRFVTVLEGVVEIDLLPEIEPAKKGVLRLHRSACVRRRTSGLEVARSGVTIRELVMVSDFRRESQSVN
jgi:hypothetical protein